MIRRFLKSLEDPESPLMAPNIWALKQVGFLLPKNMLAKSLFIFMHSMVTLFVITQFMELYVIRSNLDSVLTNLKLSILSLVAMFKVITFIYWQKSWKEVIEYIVEADKIERQNRDEPKGKVIDAYTKYCRRVTFSYWVLVFLTFLTTIGQPLIKYLISIFRENFENGTEDFPHVFSAWTPFDKNHAPGIWITLIGHILLCGYGAAVVASYDGVVVVIMVFFGGKLDLLRERCKQMFGEGGRISDQEAVAVVHELHNVHVMLLKYSRLFNSLLSPVMFLYMVVCTLMLCASAYQLSSATTTAEKLLTAQFLIFGVAQLFAFCWHSNGMHIKNENVYLGPYESEWWNATLQQKKSILTLSGQLQIDNIFSAGPFANLTLPTFINILKGAYSYYTLLRG